jgi:hypothetical protein
MNRGTQQCHRVQAVMLTEQEAQSEDAALHEKLYGDFLLK